MSYNLEFSIYNYPLTNVSATDGITTITLGNGISVDSITGNSYRGIIVSENDSASITVSADGFFPQTKTVSDDVVQDFTLTRIENLYGWTDSNVSALNLYAWTRTVTIYGITSTYICYTATETPQAWDFLCAFNGEKLQEEGRFGIHNANSTHIVSSTSNTITVFSSAGGNNVSTRDSTSDVEITRFYAWTTSDSNFSAVQTIYTNTDSPSSLLTAVFNSNVQPLDITLIESSTTGEVATSISAISSSSITFSLSTYDGSTYTSTGNTVVYNRQSSYDKTGIPSVYTDLTNPTTASLLYDNNGSEINRMINAVGQNNLSIGPKIFYGMTEAAAYSLWYYFADNASPLSGSPVYDETGAISNYHFVNDHYIVDNGNVASHEYHNLSSKLYYNKKTDSVWTLSVTYTGYSSSCDLYIDIADEPHTYKLTTYSTNSNLITVTSGSVPSGTFTATIHPAVKSVWIYPSEGASDTCVTASSNCTYTDNNANGVKITPVNYSQTVTATIYNDW